MKRLIIVGSPRANGRSAHLAEMLFEANIDERPEDELFLVPVSEVEIGPCIGCNACRKKSGVIVKGDDGAELTLQKHRCVFDDDMQTLYDLLDDVDEVSVVSPIYFSGAPAPMKCVIDRLQPYFWARLEVRESGEPLPEKRPLTLHVLGEGGDPHGYDALVSEVKSAFATADFRLERVLDWVGKIDESGEITAEATEILLSAGAQATAAGADGEGTIDREPAGAKAIGKKTAKSRVADYPTAGAQATAGRAKARPKLDLHSGIADSGSGQGESRKPAKSASSAKKRQPTKGPTTASASGSRKPRGKRHGK